MARFTSRHRSVLEDPEEVLNLAQRWLESAKSQWKWLLLGAGVVAVALTAWGVKSNIQAAREDRAAAQLFQIRPQLSQADAKSAQALKELIDKYPGTKTAYEAEMLRANLLYQMKNYGEAARSYEALLQGRDPGWNNVISESLSYCYEGLGDFKKAAATLKPVAEQSAKPFDSTVMQRLALLYEKAGDPKEAAVYWRKLLDQQPPPPPGMITALKEKVAVAEAQAAAPKK